MPILGDDTRYPRRTVLISSLPAGPPIPSTAIVPASRNLTLATGKGPGAAASHALGDVLEGALVGHVLANRYQFRAVIGGGRSSIVYRARDLRLDRDVAIKVLTAHVAASDGVSFHRARFAREARMAAGIRHPNVVSVFDYGTDGPLGIDFLVMELLEGGTLSSLIRRFGRPRLSATVRLLRQAAAGLASGHRAGLIHRDVNPNNLILEADGADLRLKILDFGGTAGQVDSASRGGAGDRWMPTFASPEQLRGDRPLAAASDVFSLGAVAHHLVTGDHLWGTSGGTRALREMEAAQDSLVRDRTLPLKLREVIGQALASHPADRFGDAREMLIALDAIRVEELVESPRKSGSVVSVGVPVSGSVEVGRTVDTAVPSHGFGLPLLSPRVGSAFVFGTVASICFLTAVVGHWNTVAAAMTILFAAALAPLPGEADGVAGPARFLALSAATLILLGVIVARAMAGSVPDLLAAQMIISRILLWVTPQQPRQARISR